MSNRIKSIFISVLAIVIALAMLPLIVSATYSAATDIQSDNTAAAIVSNGEAADGTGTMTGSPVSLVTGAQTPTVTVEGTFVIALPAGMTGTAASGGWVITGSPVALVAGNNTITVEAGGAGTITITTVGGGVTTLTLTQDLYRNTSASINSMTSTTGGSVPTFVSWTAGTNALVVRGLGSTTPQNITVNYDYDGNTGYTGFNAIMVLIPLLVLVGMIIVAILNTLWAFKKGD